METLDHSIKETHETSTTMLLKTTEGEEFFGMIEYIDRGIWGNKKKVEAILHFYIFNSKETLNLPCSHIKIIRPISVEDLPF